MQSFCDHYWGVATPEGFYLVFFFSGRNVSPNNATLILYSFSFSIRVVSLFCLQIYIFPPKNVFLPKMTYFAVTPSWLPLDTTGFGKQCYLECSMWFCKACRMYLEKSFKAETSILNNFCTIPVRFICWKTKF